MSVFSCQWGHSELVYMKHEFSFEVIGQTLDDAIGEAYDKVGRVLHLPYPGGQSLIAWRKKESIAINCHFQ